MIVRSAPLSFPAKRLQDEMQDERVESYNMTDALTTMDCVWKAKQMRESSELFWGGSEYRALSRSSESWKTLRALLVPIVYQHGGLPRTMANLTNGSRWLTYARSVYRALLQSPSHIYTRHPLQALCFYQQAADCHRPPKKVMQAAYAQLTDQAKALLDYMGETSNWLPALHASADPNVCTPCFVLGGAAIPKMPQVDEGWAELRLAQVTPLRNWALQQILLPRWNAAEVKKAWQAFLADTNVPYRMRNNEAYAEMQRGQWPENEMYFLRHQRYPEGQKAVNIPAGYDPILSLLLYKTIWERAIGDGVPWYQLATSMNDGKSFEHYWVKPDLFFLPSVRHDLHYTMATGYAAVWTRWYRALPIGIQTLVDLSMRHPGKVVVLPVEKEEKEGASTTPEAVAVNQP